MRICGVRRVCYSRGVKFVHAADLHIDSPLRGLDRYEGAPAARLRAATRRALENLVALCIEEQAAFLLLAGDVFDGGWKDFSTGPLLRLADDAPPRGEHPGRHRARQPRRRERDHEEPAPPDNVRELSSKKPETFELADAGICVHGQSFAQQATTDDLAARYPDAVRGAFNIGLLHTCLDGREGHDRYAPTSLETMRAKGYDYWALGHVHAREVLSTEPWVVFPGNLQGRHAKETGREGREPRHRRGRRREERRASRARRRALGAGRRSTRRDATDAIEVVDRARDVAREARRRVPRAPARRARRRSRAHARERRASGTTSSASSRSSARPRTTRSATACGSRRSIVQTRSTFDLVEGPRGGRRRRVTSRAGSRRSRTTRRSSPSSPPCSPTSTRSCRPSFARATARSC